MNRQEALAQLEEGFPVLVKTDTGTRLLESPVAAQGQHGRKSCEAALPAEGKFAPARHADGTWTHEALVTLTRTGQGVLLGREVITSPEDLPTSSKLAGMDAKKHAAVVEGLDSQIASLTAERSRAEAAKVEAEASARLKGAEEIPAPHPTPTHAPAETHQAAPRKK